MKGIAERLLRGSASIDCMRAEIKSVVRLVCGLVDKMFGITEFGNPYGLRPKKIRFSSGEVNWEVWVMPDEGIPVYAFVNYPGGSCGSGTLDCIPIEQVQLIHEHLDDFVLGVLNAYPNLYKVWQPLLAAANKFPPA